MNLLKSSEFLSVQKKYIQTYINIAFNMVKDYKLTTERSLVLCFDIGVQNGSIGKEGRKDLLEKVRNNSLN